MVGNIRGNDLAFGNLANATTIFDYFPPNPPVGVMKFHYVYLVSEQTNGIVSDWSSVEAMGTTKLPIQDIADHYLLNLITSNYFVAKKAKTARSSSY
jgi:hypothetical protein